MALIYRKPKDWQQLLDIWTQTNTKGNLVSSMGVFPEVNEAWFKAVTPIVMIYEKLKFLGLAYFYHDRLVIVDADEIPINERFSPAQLSEIKVNIKQIELF